MSQKFNVDNAAEIEAFLASHAYLSGGPHPGAQDAEVL